MNQIFIFCVGDSLKPLHVAHSSNDVWLHPLLSLTGGVGLLLHGMQQLSGCEQLCEQVQAVGDGVGDLGDGVLRHPGPAVVPGVPGHHALGHILTEEG